MDLTNIVNNPVRERKKKKKLLLHECKYHLKTKGGISFRGRVSSDLSYI